MFFFLKNYFLLCFYLYLLWGDAAVGGKYFENILFEIYTSVETLTKIPCTYGKIYVWCLRMPVRGDYLPCSWRPYPNDENIISFTIAATLRKNVWFTISSENSSPKFEFYIFNFLKSIILQIKFCFLHLWSNATLFCIYTTVHVVSGDQRIGVDITKKQFSNNIFLKLFVI